MNALTSIREVRRGETKMAEDYEIKFESFMSEDGEKVVTNLKISDNLKNLLNLFVVKDEGNVKFEFLGNVFNRYKIKSALKNSTCWDIYTDMMFLPQLVSDGEVKLEIQMAEQYNNFCDCLRKLIESMLRLKEKRTMTVTFNIKKEAD